ncbi:MAG: winged helix-turn-helix transcriptional regulator [Muribaculaceae bacterium]|nr:winged helix-turn-helix transcriptional regulator [Muribaculaceae bacterium]
MSKLVITAEQERLARLAKAMGHPTRVAILEFLAKRDECFFGEIHEVLSVSKPTVSQHLSELKEAGLIQGTIEPPKVRYCLNCETWKEAKALFTALFDECCKDEKRGGCCG